MTDKTDEILARLDAIDDKVGLSPKKQRLASTFVLRPDEGLYLFDGKGDQICYVGALLVRNIVKEWVEKAEY